MMFLEKVCFELKKNRVDYAIVGGHAVALHGAIRGTLDIDFVIKWEKGQCIRAEKAMKALGLQSRLPITGEMVFLYRQEYIEKKNLIAWNFFNPCDPTEQVDLIINYDLRNKEIKKIKTTEVTINLLGKKDLIAMKRAANRPQDQEDIKALQNGKN